MDEHLELKGRRILVVEDDYLVAQVVTDILEDAGAEVVGPVGRVDEALALIADRAHQFDSAVIDVNLHGQTSYPIADALMARKVQFVFATGYGNGAVEAAYSSHPRCQKPFSQRALLAALLPRADEG